MKKIKIALRHLALLTVLLSSITACDKDFANIDSAIINNDNATHFDTNSRQFEVIAYTKALDPVQTNALPLNLLGLYSEDSNDNFGRSTSSFVSQIRGTLTDPDFGTNAVIDSVILTIPYFSIPVGIDSDGRTEFDLDSIFGDTSINFSIYESNYFLRDFDPTASEIDSPQSYYANKSTGSNIISDSQLEGQLLYQNLEFKADPSQIILFEGEGDDRIESSRQSPAMRIKFDADAQEFWQQKIIDMAGQPELSNVNNFNDYFRGLYFKAQPDVTNASGQLLLLNMASSSSTIIIHYSRDPFTADAERIQTTYTFNFIGNRVNFISNDFTIIDGNETTGDENLFLKGGQGSVAEIKLFNGDLQEPDNLTDNAFELFKKEFVETDEDGNFVSSKKLINEANLVFYVNQNEVSNDEPDRIFLYDMNNNIALADYFFETANTVNPRFSKLGHLGPLQRENSESTGNGIRYKIRITEHLNNLILRDSTNVKLGIAVAGNVNLEGSSIQYDLLNSNDSDKVPVSSILTPKGTVLYGNNTTADNESKKLYLEIFFTEPNN
jgi:hypothetical protein